MVCEKRDSCDEIVHSLENDVLKLKYHARSATLMLNSPQVSSIRYASSVDVDQMNEKMNKIENVVSQMSSNTKTHNTFNN